MSVLFPILLGIALLMTLGVLFAGVITMGKGGAANREKSNKLMRLRIVFQGIAILIVLIALAAGSAGD